MSKMIHGDLSSPPTLIAERKWVRMGYWIAGSNWVRFEQNYEHSGRHSMMPVLQQPEKFRAFIADYSLLQRKKLEFFELVRMYLITNEVIEKIVADPSGRELVAQADRMAQKIPNCRREVSLLSKLSAFANPTNFVALDRWATGGVAKLAGVPVFAVKNDYSLYLKLVRDLMAGPIGVSIESYLKNHRAPTRNNDGFKLRVMDNYLMIAAGQWKGTLS